jgi:hypothetical protein
MTTTEQITLRGDFLLRVYRNGELIEEQHEPNLIVNMAKDAMARLIGGDGINKQITHIGFGTNGVGPNPNDTALTSAYSKPIAAVTYPATGQAAFAWTLGTSEANGKAITELGLLCEDSTLFSRKTRGAINKEADLSLDGVWTIIF